MFHDPSLERTTDTKAIIRESHWHGDNGIHKARTVKSPRQAIPTFKETVALLMKVGFGVGSQKGPYLRSARGSRES